MSFRSVAAKNVILRMVGVMTVAGAILVVGVTNESFVHAQFCHTLERVVRTRYTAAQWPVILQRMSNYAMVSSASDSSRAKDPSKCSSSTA